MHSQIPSKTIPEFRPRSQSLYPFSDQKAQKTIPFGAAHTYKANIRELAPPAPSLPPGHSLIKTTSNIAKETILRKKFRR